LFEAFMMYINEEMFLISNMWLWASSINEEEFGTTRLNKVLG